MKTLFYFLGVFLLLATSAEAQRNRGGSEATQATTTSKLSGNVQVVNAVEVNTEAFDFSPCFFDAGIVFVSSRRKHGPRDKNLGETFFDLYYADLDGNGFPKAPKSFSLEINSEHHEGPITFDSEFQTIFFTRTNVSGATKAKSSGEDTEGYKANSKRQNKFANYDKSEVGLKIYTAKRTVRDWHEVEELPFNSNRYNCIHPSLSPDGQFLYFSSDMPGGYGSYDLYVVERTGDGWSKPKNLGPGINTSGKEAFPFIHSNGSLFFSSDGWGGLGGYDLFFADLGLTEPVAIDMGPPFNSEYDDIGIMVDENGTRGFLTSNRPGGHGKDDIYRFESEVKVEEALKRKSNLTSIFGDDMETESFQQPIQVLDVESGKELDGASVRLLEWGSESGYSIDNFYDIELLPKEDGSGEFKLQMVPKSQIEIGSPLAVTDAAGTATLRIKVDQEYLLIINRPGYFPKEERISFSKAKMDKPIEVLSIGLESSDCIELQGDVVTRGSAAPVPDVVVKVINECTGEEQLVKSGVTGEFGTCLEIGCDYTLVGQRQGYRNGYTNVTTVRLRGKRVLTASLQMAPMEGVSNDMLGGVPIKTGSVIVLEDIMYDFDGAEIRDQEQLNLEALVQLMKTYPGMEIELGAHTDTQGDRDYNLNLSLRRAESAKNFLVRRGIEDNRIQAIGYGESRPRNHCLDGVECSEAEHEYNRRTEVTVTKLDEDDPLKPID